MGVLQFCALTFSFRPVRLLRGSVGWLCHKYYIMEAQVNRRAAGVIFCFIAAFLFSTRYIAAAIFGSGVQSWSVNLYRSMLKYVGETLTVWALIAFIVGIVYLVIAERHEPKSKSKIAPKE